MDEAAMLDDTDVLVIVGRSWGWSLFFGIVSLIVGVLVIIHPKHSVYFVAILLAIWLLIVGIYRIIVAIADTRDTAGTRWLMAAVGMLAIVLGVVILHHTHETINVVAFLVGLFWLLAGLADFFSGYVNKGIPGRGFAIFAGLLGVAVGTLALVYPGLSLTIIALLFGIWLAIYGALEIAYAFQMRAALKG
jgi:uncharacterized membrane protein HdeD (DUF308 family)